MILEGSINYGLNIARQSISEVGLPWQRCMLSLKWGDS